ncbi:MAG: hypothetical protein JSW07_21065, partial [bacterium]
MIKVIEGNEKPYFTHGQCFRRIGAASRKLSKDELFQFGIETGIIVFELQQVKNATIGDIDEEVVRTYIEKANVNIFEDRIEVESPGKLP